MSSATCISLCVCVCVCRESAGLWLGNRYGVLLSLDSVFRCSPPSRDLLEKLGAWRENLPSHEKCPDCHGAQQLVSLWWARVCRLNCVQIFSCGKSHTLYTAKCVLLSYESDFQFPMKWQAAKVSPKFLKAEGPGSLSTLDTFPIVFCKGHVHHDSSTLSLMPPHIPSRPFLLEGQIWPGLCVNSSQLSWAFSKLLFIDNISWLSPKMVNS